MTRLRVLSGKHAGASIDLELQEYTLGANDDFDIYIGDWDAQNIKLQVGDDGLVRASWPAESNQLVQIVGSTLQDDDQYVFEFKAFAPIRFGSVIICFGPIAQAWPSDADVLQKLYLPGPAVEEQKQDVPPKLFGGLRKYAVVMTVIVMSGIGAITLGTSFGVSPRRAPAAPVSTTPLIERVKEALIFAGASYLVVRQEAALVIVDGLLETREQASRVNQKLDALHANTQISRRYRSTDDVLDMIRESLSSYPLQVKHGEGKSFVVEGQVADPARVKAVLDGVQGDLAGYGVTIVTNLKSASRPTEGITAVFVDDFGISYTQTRDGVKHLLPKATTGARGDERTEPVIPHMPRTVEQPRIYAPAR